jgi:hypothetical protein
MTDIERQAQNYMFASPYGKEATVNALRGTNPHFAHFIPLADDQGRLVTDTLTLISVSHLAEGDLAWSFIEAFMQAEAAFHGEADFPVCVFPIDRALFHAYVNNSIMYPLLDYTARPAWIPPQRFYVPAAEIPLARFTSGELTAAEYARLNHDALLAWMGREVTVREIEFVIPEPPEPETGVQFLTIQYWDIMRLEGVIAQAEAALNAERAARGEAERVRVIPQTISVEDIEHQWARMPAILMAGQGPDIFWLSWQPYWHYAVSGYLADIYPLIDRCPYASRGDFYTNALKPFEAAGGLYAFPMNYGVNYIAVNDSLPRHLIDRFAQKSTVSIPDLMDIYLELKRGYGGDYGHLHFANGPISDAEALVTMMLNDFINFDTRTANLTDNRFVAFLHNLTEVFEGVMPGDVPVRFPMDFNNSQHEEIMAQRVVFYVPEIRGSPITPYIPRGVSRFAHHKPLANTRGQLMLNVAFGDTFCVTSAGNPELAWAFLRHLTHAMTLPDPNVQYHTADGYTYMLNFGAAHFETPIIRELFKPHLRNSFANFFNQYNSLDGWVTRDIFVGMNDETLRGDALERVASGLAARNEMEMTLSVPYLPSHFFKDPLDQLLRGVITPEVAAQRMHNSISLWLMEQ